MLPESTLRDLPKRLCWFMSAGPARSDAAKLQEPIVGQRQDTLGGAGGDEVLSLLTAKRWM